jgi:hypothetical protein
MAMLATIELIMPKSAYSPSLTELTYAETESDVVCRKLFDLGDFF